MRIDKPLPRRTIRMRMDHSLAERSGLMSNRSLTLFRGGAWSFIVVGAGHVAFELVHRLAGAPSPLDAELRAQAVEVLGLRRSLFALNLGFSVAMALFTLASGALTLLVARAMPGPLT